MNLATLRERAPSLAVTWTTAAGLALVAPLEHAAGLALHLGWWHAWTLTALIEGAAGSAILAGRLVPAALALTGSSVLLGTLQSAGALPRTAPVVLAAGVTLLAVASLLLVHRVRAGVQRARAARAAESAHDARRMRAEEDERARAAADRARTDADAARRHEVEVERQRRWADEQAARTAVELERVRLEAAREVRASGAPDDLRERRAHAEWERREGTTKRMTGDELAPLLGYSVGHARKVAARWRTEARRAAGRDEAAPTRR